MTNDNKNLRLIDLYARLPYGVKAEAKGWDEEKNTEVFVIATIYSIDTDGYIYFDDNVYDIAYCRIEECRPYLRPLSTMTEEEEEEFKQVLEIELDHLANNEVGHTMKSAASSAFEIDFYNKHHFDYRGLIEKGFALEATKSMYKSLTT